MVRDSFFRMSMQKPLQHSFVYGSVWPTILKGNEKGKRDHSTGVHMMSWSQQMDEQLGGTKQHIQT